jgi:hypothetical protein
MSKIQVELEDFQAKELLQLNSGRIQDYSKQVMELNSKIEKLQKQNEWLSMALNNGKAIPTSQNGSLKIGNSKADEEGEYSWRGEIRDYYANHIDAHAGARIISDLIFDRDSVTDKVEQQRIRNKISIAMSTMCGKGILVGEGKNKWGENLYSFKK